MAAAARRSERLCASLHARGSHKIEGEPAPQVVRGDGPRVVDPSTVLGCVVRLGIHEEELKEQVDDEHEIDLTGERVGKDEGGGEGAAAGGEGGGSGTMRCAEMRRRAPVPMEPRARQCGSASEMPTARVRCVVARGSGRSDGRTRKGLEEGRVGGVGGVARPSQRAVALSHRSVHPEPRVPHCLVERLRRLDEAHLVGRKQGGKDEGHCGDNVPPRHPLGVARVDDEPLTPRLIRTRRRRTLVLSCHASRRDHPAHPRRPAYDVVRAADGPRPRPCL